MLRAIKGTLLKKQQDLSLSGHVSTLARQAVQEYITKTYPDAVVSVTVRYDVRERLVVISTPSKALAGELTLNAGDLRAHLTAQNVPVSRIVAR